MSIKKKLLELKKHYRDGVNIIDYLRNSDDFRPTNIDDILLSYDLQAGSYTQFSKQNAEYLSSYVRAILKVLEKLENFETFLEVGVGEATVSLPLANKIIQNQKLNFWGFDISWSRVRYAVENLKSYPIQANFFCADLFSIPLPDSSIDVVFSNHSLEPNGGREIEALIELSRVAGKYIILLEPDFERADSRARERMNRHNYVRGLAEAASNLGINVLIDEPFLISQNSLNPTGLLVLKVVKEKINSPAFTCLLSKKPMKKLKNIYTDFSCGLLYPIIDNIPCLTLDNAIVGTSFEKFNR